MANDITLISEAVYALRENFTAVAVDRGVNFDKEAGFALQIIGGSDYMMSAAMNNRQSVENAITNVAAIGISLNPAKKQAYLVVRGKVICLDISYIGLIDLAVKTGSILWAQANVVREHDNFIINGFDKPPTHGHDPFAGAEARGRIKGAYVVVKTPDGEYLTHTMDIDSIYAVRDKSAESWKKNKSGPWATDEGEMIKKTVVKQAQKYWPKTERSGPVEQAIQLLNTDGGEGYAAISNNGSKYPAGELQNWIAQAEAAKNEVDLSTIWKKGIAAIKPSKDMAAHEEFKAVVSRRGAVLKSQMPTDVTAKPAKQTEKFAQQPSTNTATGEIVTTVDEVMKKLNAAKNEDALHIAADWMNALPEYTPREALEARYDERLNELRGA